MTFSEFISLAALAGSFVVTGANIWWQGRQEKARAARSTAERDANRNERLHEHWLDTKIALYRQFLSTVRAAESLILMRFEPSTVTMEEDGTLQPGPYPRDAMRAAHEALDELLLVAPKSVGESASRYFYSALWNVDMIYLHKLQAEQDSDIEADQRANEEWLENEEEQAAARSEFRNRVRQELGLELLPPSKRQKMQEFSVFSHP